MLPRESAGIREISVIREAPAGPGKELPEPTPLETFVDEEAGHCKPFNGGFGVEMAYKYGLKELQDLVLCTFNNTTAPVHPPCCLPSCLHSHQARHGTVAAWLSLQQLPFPLHE